MKQKNTARNVTKSFGAGLAVAGAAAALGYYFYGSDKARQHRKVAVKWAGDMKTEVIREAKLLKKVTPKALAAVVDKVARMYRDVRDVEPSELKRAARELKENWEMIERETRAATKKTIRKAVKKAKKTLKKRSAKEEGVY